LAIYYTVVVDVLWDPSGLYRKIFGVSVIAFYHCGLAVAVLKWIRAAAAKIQEAFSKICPL
jgi:hypothetical protein